MARSAKDRQMVEMKDTILQLNNTVQTLTLIVAENKKEKEDFQRREQEHLERERVMQEQIDYLTKKLFGKKSEKRDDDWPGQMNLFNEAEATQQKPTPEEAELITVEQHTRKKKGTLKDKFKGIPVKKEYLDLPEEEKVCSVCGTPLERIGEEYVRSELHYIPAQISVIEYYSINYGCPQCKVGEEIPHIVQGKDSHPHMIHGMASSSTLAWIMYQKYRNSMPLYRIEQEFKRMGAPIGRNTLSHWIINNAREFFAPMCDLFRRRLISSRYAMADETPVQVLKEPERRPETKSFMWVFRTGEYEPENIVLFHYSETRAGETAKEYLEGFKGYLMTDGYSGYNKLKFCIRTSCWAHVRRYLVDAIPKGKENDYTVPAVQGLMYIQKLFDLEAKIHAKSTSYDAIKEERLKKEKPVLASFWEWLDKQTSIKGSRMEKALIYIRNRKPFLENYLLDGGCSFSNNTSERSCKAFVTGRKNWLFSDTPKGADASALVYSIVETAKANNVDVYYYLQYLMDMAPNTKMSDDELEKLAPWQPDVKAEIQRRHEAHQKAIFDAM